MYRSSPRSPIHFLLATLPFLALGAEDAAHHIDLTTHWVGITCLALFAFAYLVVMGTEFPHLPKSKPVIPAILNAHKNGSH